MVLKLFIILSVLYSTSVDVPSLYSHTKKKTDKILRKYWENDEYHLVRSELSGIHQPEIYAVQHGDAKPYAFIIFDEAASKVDTFIYMVIFKPDGVIDNVSVLLYKENYGGEIASKRFLKQFEGKSAGLNMEYKQDIDGISGATISVQAITLGVRKNSLTFSKIKEQLQ